MSGRASFWENDEASVPTRELKPAAGPLAKGARIGGWTVQALLGEGGSARVYRCTKGRTRAAVKVHDGEGRAEFAREGALLQKLGHPRVVRVLEVGDGFIALELLEGRTLEERLSRPLDSGAAAALLGQALDALGAVHAASLVHRDVKPSNLFVSPDDRRLTLLDFGIAREGARVKPTADTHVRGTLDYMAPEQLDGQPVGPRADLYALGCVAYRIVLGRPPFAGTMAEQLTARLKAVRVGKGPLSRFITALLAPRERDRPSSAAAARELLP